MKRLVYVTMLVALALALLPGAALAHDCDNPAQYPLYAGQTILVGYVYVCNDANGLTVTYDTSSTGWPISETHLAVGDQLSDIPQTKTGNPIPGQFKYGDPFNPAVTTATYTIPKAEIGPNLIPNVTPVYIAAHAVVWNPASTGFMQVCSDGNETYTAYNNAVLGPDAGAGAPRTGTAYPSAEPYGEQFDTAASVWDLGVGAPFGNTSGDSGCADWIWEKNLMDVVDAGGAAIQINQVVNPVNGDRVEFTEYFSLPGPFANGMLYASSDNAYEAYVNTTTPGAPLITGQAFGDWWNSNLYEASVNTDGWQSVESAALTGLSQGSNYLFFRSANEYMAPDDLFNPTPGSAPIIDVLPGPFAFVPSAYINPAGMIWQADVNYYNDDETAWGAQGPGPGSNQFPGRNWATYIKYTWQ